MVSSSIAWYIRAAKSKSIITCRGKPLHYTEVVHRLSLSLNSREILYSCPSHVEQGAERHYAAIMKFRMYINIVSWLSIAEIRAKSQAAWHRHNGT